MILSWFRKDKKSENKKEGCNTKQKVARFNEEGAKRILQKIKEEFGLDYERQMDITLKKLERFAIKNEIFTFEELFEALKASSRLKSELINLLTVGETYFYRELEQIEILCGEVLSGRCSRILSAPCSSGEEVYSILLYLDEKGYISPSLHITGIDINSDALRQAEIGCYSKRSISQLPQKIVQKSFTPKDSRFCIDTKLKSYTSFTYANIFDPRFEEIGRFDAVLSRNMMIYFNDEQKRRAIEQLSSVMHTGSLLFLGHADISFTPKGFKKLQKGRTSYYQKQ